MWLQFSLNQAGLIASLIEHSVLNSLQLFQVSILKYRILASTALRFATEHLLLLQLLLLFLIFYRTIPYNMKPVRNEVRLKLKWILSYDFK